MSQDYFGFGTSFDSCPLLDFMSTWDFENPEEKIKKQVYSLNYTKNIIEKILIMMVRYDECF